MVAVINNAHAPQIERGSASSEEIHGSSVEISDGSADESEYGSSVTIDDGSSVQSETSVKGPLLGPDFLTLTTIMVEQPPQLPAPTQVSLKKC